MKLSIHQYLTRAGIFKSKKEVFDAIKNSQIKIDKEIITNPNHYFNISVHEVFYKNKSLSDITEKVYILLNKPLGYLCSKLTDEEKKLNKKSIFEIINKDATIDEKTKNSLFSVGRLDEDTQGLLIITNDGKLSSRITNPDHEVNKTYLVVLKNKLSQHDIHSIEMGMYIDLEENGRIYKYKSKKCKILPETSNRIKITVKEGKKREIRRMFEKIGNQVLTLERVSIGNLKLKDLNLKESQYMFIEKKFIEQRLK